MSSLPLQNTEYVFYVALGNSTNPENFDVNPTIAAGDFQISIDGGHRYGAPAVIAMARAY